MHDQLWDQLKGLDPNETAQRALCQYSQDLGRYTLKLLNRTYVVDPQSQELYAESPDSEPVGAGFLQQLCILVYLINAKNLPLAGQLVKGESFAGGMFFFRGQHALPTQRLVDAFGTRPDLLLEGSRNLPAQKCSFGDASITVTVLPRVPVTLIVWGADEEFDASASILFDATACEHLPLDGLLAAVNLTLDAILSDLA